MDDKIQALKEMVDGSDNIVFFGGAGVSTESGIPDFRSTGGLYHQEWKSETFRLIWQRPLLISQERPLF